MGQKKKDPHQRLDALERVSGWGTLIILAGIVLEIWFFFGLDPHDPRERFLSLVANCLIALGLIIEYVAIRLTIVAAGEAKIEADGKVAAAEARAAVADQKAEEARARTADAQLQLHKLMQPRRLELKQFLAKLKGKKPPAIIEIMYSPIGPDCLWLATWLSGFLSMANWPVQSVAKIPPSSDWRIDAAWMVGGTPWGFTVAVNDLEKDGPWRALQDALSAALGESVPATRHDKLPEGTIRVVISPRP